MASTGASCCTAASSTASPIRWRRGRPAGHQVRRARRHGQLARDGRPADRRLLTIRSAPRFEAASAGGPRARRRSVPSGPWWRASQRSAARPGGTRVVEHPSNGPADRARLTRPSRRRTPAPVAAMRAAFAGWSPSTGRHTMGSPAANTFVIVLSPHCVITADTYGNTASWGTNVSTCTLAGMANVSLARAGPRVTTARTGRSPSASRTRCMTGPWPCGRVLRLTSTNGRSSSSSAGCHDPSEPGSRIAPT